MAQLTWQNVNTDFGGGRSNAVDLFGGGLDTIRTVLEKHKTKQEEDASMAEVNAALQITDPDAMEAAKRAGVFKIDKNNVDFFRTHTSDLLARQLAKLQQQKVEGELEAQPYELEAKKLANQNTGLVIEQNQQLLKENLYNWNEKLDQKALRPEVQKRIAQIQSVATGGVDADGKVMRPSPEGAIRLARDPETVQMMIDSGMTNEQIAALPAAFYTSADLARGEDRKAYDFGVETGDRELKTERQRKIDEFNFNENIRKNAAGERGEAAGQRGEVTARQTFEKEQETVADLDFATKNLPNIISANLTIPEMEEAINNYEGASIGAKNAMRKALNEALPTIATMSPEEWETRLREKDPYGPSGPRTLEPGTAATDLMGYIDQTEGKGDYGTLYGHSQKSGGRFEGYDVTTKTISELDQFARDQYGNWVKGQNNGVFASPMGRFQIVNDTLQSAAKALGMGPETIFDKKTQDTIFKYLVGQRLTNTRARGGEARLQEQMTGLRQEWAGLKNVDDASLAKAITQFEQGNFSGLEAAMGGAGRPVDESQGPAAAQAIKQLAEKEGPLNYQEWNVLESQVIASDDAAQELNSKMTIDDAFGGQTGGLMKALQDKDSMKLLAGEVVAKLGETYKDIDPGRLTDDLNIIAGEFGVAPSVAAAFALAAPEKTAWLWGEGLGAANKRYINKDTVRKLMAEYIDPNEGNAEQRTAGAMAELEKDRAKVAASGELAAVQSRVREAWAANAQAAAKKEKNPDFDDRKYRRRLAVALEQQTAIMDRINSSEILKARQKANNPGANR